MARKRGKTPRAKGVSFGEVRKQKRALTESVVYHIRYRDRKTGAFTKFKPGKSLNPVLFQTISRLTPDREESTVRTAQAQVGRNLVVLPARKAKKPLTPAAVTRIVETRILKRKVAKRNLQATDKGAKIAYPARVRAKPLEPEPPKKKRKKRRKSKPKKKRKKRRR